ncbi:stAR-related lipid transfer protein 7, mitochondrial-like [Saccostrea cucullata]|uniref:stAR-related lipid transfer protein 7, mitochondrial-like n=1 Tax=Saccostrea cuccullata TaxID=36930 RepID=UPI002ED131FB
MAPEGLYLAFRRFSQRIVRVNHNSERERSELLNRVSVRLKAHPLYRAYIDYITENFKTFSEKVKTQYKGVIAQKIRRTIEYENTHGHKSLIRFLQSLRNAFWSRKGPQLSALFAASLFSWKEENITDQDISRLLMLMHMTESLMYIAFLPFYVCISFTVYGRYDDVSPSAFYQVQIDLDYRKKWDHYVVKLEVIDQDPVSKSEVVQWITDYPATWYSREFLYIRRFKIDKERNVMAFVARAVDHPECPKKNDFVRVDPYSSYMVIKPNTTFEENGLEYVMTYHDDPQLMYSSLAFSFATSIGIDFVAKMHKAAKDLQKMSGFRPSYVPSSDSSVSATSSGNYIPNYQ